MGSLSLTSEQETCSELSSWSPVWHTPPPKPRQRLIPTTDSDTPDWDTMASVRLRPSLKLKLMLRLIPTTDMDMDWDMLVLDMLDLDTPDLDTPDLDTLGWDTMVSVRLKLSPKQRLMLRLIPTMDMDMDLDMPVLDMLDLDTPDLDTPDLDTPGLDTLA